MENSCRVRSIFGNSRFSPYCTLIEYHGINILCDIGWDGQDDESQFQSLKDVLCSIPVHLILLSHATYQHAGGFVYATRYLGLNAPVVCSIPVAYLLHSLMLDTVKLRRNHGGLRLFSSSDVSSAFASLLPSPTGTTSACASSPFVTLNYHQLWTYGSNIPKGRAPTAPGLRHLSVRLWPSGCGFGGGVFVLVHRHTYIVYAPSIRHTRDNTVLPPFPHRPITPHRPFLLITDVAPMTVTARPHTPASPHSSKTPDQETKTLTDHTQVTAQSLTLPSLRGISAFLDVLLTHLRRDRLVIVPCDVSGSDGPPILCALDSYWRANGLHMYSIAVLSPQGGHTAHLIRGFLDFAAQDVIDAVVSSSSNIFCNPLDLLRNTRYLNNAVRAALHRSHPTRAVAFSVAQRPTIRWCTTLDQLAAVRPRPVLVLVAPASLDYGPGALLAAVGVASPGVTFVFPSLPPPGTHARAIFDTAYCEAHGAVSLRPASLRDGTPRTQLDAFGSVPPTGSDIVKFQIRLRVPCPLGQETPPDPDGPLPHLRHCVPVPNPISVSTQPPGPTPLPCPAPRPESPTSSPSDALPHKKPSKRRRPPSPSCSGSDYSTSSDSSASDTNTHIPTPTPLSGSRSPSQPEPPPMPRPIPRPAFPETLLSLPALPTQLLVTGRPLQLTHPSVLADTPPDAPRTQYPSHAPEAPPMHHTAQADIVDSATLPQSVLRMSSGAPDRATKSATLTPALVVRSEIAYVPTLPPPPSTDLADIIAGILAPRALVCLHFQHASTDPAAQSPPSSLTLIERLLLARARGADKLAILYSGLPDAPTEVLGAVPSIRARLDPRIIHSVRLAPSPGSEASAVGWLRCLIRCTRGSSLPEIAPESEAQDSSLVSVSSVCPDIAFSPIPSGPRASLWPLLGLATIHTAAQRLLGDGLRSDFNVLTHCRVQAIPDAQILVVQLPSRSTDRDGSGFLRPGPAAVVAVPRDGHVIVHGTPGHLVNRVISIIRSLFV